jgi:hypothetical protein
LAFIHSYFSLSLSLSSKTCSLWKECV